MRQRRAQSAGGSSEDVRIDRERIRRQQEETDRLIERMKAARERVDEAVKRSTEK